MDESPWRFESSRLHHGGELDVGSLEPPAKRLAPKGVREFDSPRLRLERVRVDEELRSNRSGPKGFRGANPLLSAHLHSDHRLEAWPSG